MKLESYLKFLQEIKNLKESRDYDNLCSLIDELLEKYPVQADLLHKKYIAQSLRLGVDIAIEKNELTSLLNSAIQIMPNWTEPYIELGHREYINNNHEAAINLFKKVNELAEKKMIDAYKGQILCLIDMEQIDEARKLFNKLKGFELDDEGNDIFDIEISCPELDEDFDD